MRPSVWVGRSGRAAARESLSWFRRKRGFGQHGLPVISNNYKKHVIMRKPSSNRTRDPSRSGSATNGFPMAALPTVLLVCLSIALVTACAGGQDTGQKANAGGGTVDVMFPQHDVPPAEYWRERFVGKLTLEDGCLRAGSVLLVWPAGFTFDTKNGVVRVIDADGRIVAHGGDDVRFSRAHVPFEEAWDGGRIDGLSDDCSGPYWLVGGEVVAISPGEPAKPPVVKGPEVYFPQHDAPLGTDDGGSYWAGQLVLHDGCLGVEVPPDVNGPGGTTTLIWPSGFAADVEGLNVRVVDAGGRVAARVGDHIRLTRATITYNEALDRGLISGMPGDCEGPYFMVGDEVTAFDPENESTELWLTEPDVFFPRERTVIATFRDQMLAGGGGELVLDGQCLRLNGTTTVIWPAGFTPHVEGGVVQVRNGAGVVIAQVGDKLSMGGGYFNRDDWECPGEVFAVHSIEVVPDPSPLLQEAGYAGTYQDPEDRGILYVRLVNPSQEAAEEAAERYESPYLLEDIREIRPIKAEYSIEQLKEWHESVADEIRSIPAVRLWMYAFERNGLMAEVIRKDDADVVRKILDILTRYEVPHGAVVILDE